MESSTLWIIDGQTHQVAVQGPDGSLLGAWTALGLEDPEGIAVSDSDVWIVDAGRDEIVLFVGAAGLTAGAALAAKSGLS